MASYQNIQTLNQRAESKYPFDSAAKLFVGNCIFPCSMITSLRFQVTSAVFPLYIGEIKSIPKDTIRYIVKDSQSQVKGNIDIYMGQQGPVALVKDTFGCVCGGMTFDKNLYKWSLQLIRGTVQGHLQLPPDMLPLSSFVISCCHYKGYRGASINTQYIGNSIILNFEKNIDPAFTQTSMRLDIYGDYQPQIQADIEQPSRLISVNGIDLTGKSLTIKHRTLSDLRVITQNGHLTLAGVTDDIS